MGMQSGIGLAIGRIKTFGTITGSSLALTPGAIESKAFERRRARHVLAP
jgi:hypothetical protein